MKGKNDNHLEGTESIRKEKRNWIKATRNGQKRDSYWEKKKQMSRIEDSQSQVHVLLEMQNWEMMVIFILTADENAGVEVVVVLHVNSHTELGRCVQWSACMSADWGLSWGRRLEVSLHGNWEKKPSNTCSCWNVQWHTAFSCQVQTQL